MKQVAELYKRQVKADKEVGTRVKLMIKNYRLHCIKDEASELNPTVRKLSNLNKGTSIYVSNSSKCCRNALKYEVIWSKSLRYRSTPKPRLK